ncbi:hypothetical protein [Alistipes sp.]|uniref:hypothetical protein n=1 Tax=Alistipes sp. TaxID=1872444 RepID=UPI003AF0961F
MKLKVLVPFRDKIDHKTWYKVGDTLVTDDIDRINQNIKRGLCEVVSPDNGETVSEAEAESAQEKEQPAAEMVSFKEQEYSLADVKAALAALDIPVAANARVKGVTKVLGVLTEEQAAALREALTKEAAGDDPS